MAPGKAYGLPWAAFAAAIPGAGMDMTLFREQKTDDRGQKTYIPKADFLVSVLPYPVICHLNHGQQ
jgi:hypothetical protein